MEQDPEPMQPSSCGSTASALSSFKPYKPDPHDDPEDSDYFPSVDEISDREIACFGHSDTAGKLEKARELAE